MKGARKEAPPAEFTAWLEMENDDWKPSYALLSGDVRAAVVQALHAEQRGLCLYCGCRLSMEKPGKTFHIEHFRPQEAYPELSVTHSNLFLSCGQGESPNRSETCGTKKENWFDEAAVIEPMYAGCTSRFRFKLNGTIEALDDNDHSAKEWISRLNLNHAELSKERETLLAKLDADELDLEDLWDANTSQASSFAHVAHQYLGQVLP
jgi:uncharacterized protein (TIGR02646 family)